MKAQCPMPASELSEKKFVGILFECCRVYQRIYKDEQKRAYIGRCPKCGRKAEIRIGPGGTDARFFKAY